MTSPPSLTLHVLPPSHPCMTADAALRRKGLEYERIELRPGEHNAKMEEVYGEGARTVPGQLPVGWVPERAGAAPAPRRTAVSPTPLRPEAAGGQ
ncbi:MAG: hypothetical protein ACR2KD_03920, partial [Thermoleophilaceae bacterium]